MKELELKGLSEQDTARIGEKLGEGLFPGAFIALYGGNGAGKTTLTRSIAAAFGIRGILSPTFTIVREYAGRIPLFHFDAYRLGDADELYAIGFDEYMNFVLDGAQEIDVKTEKRVDVGRILLKGDAITLMQEA